MISDIVVDLQYGDCGKGKVTHHLCRTGEYTHVIRYNGGCNAGHTIFHRGKKFITHHIPAGVFFGIRSIIGPGCVVNVEQFFKEIEELKEGGIDTDGLVFIAKNAHIITKNHIAMHIFSIGCIGIFIAYKGSEFAFAAAVIMIFSRLLNVVPQFETGRFTVR